MDPIAIRIPNPVEFPQYAARFPPGKVSSKHLHAMLRQEFQFETKPPRFGCQEQLESILSL
jgi:hypothetical protein